MLISTVEISYLHVNIYKSVKYIIFSYPILQTSVQPTFSRGPIRNKASFRDLRMASGKILHEPWDLLRDLVGQREDMFPFVSNRSFTSNIS